MYLPLEKYWNWTDVWATMIAQVAQIIVVDNHYLDHVHRRAVSGPDNLQIVEFEGHPYSSHTHN